MERVRTLMELVLKREKMKKELVILSRETSAASFIEIDRKVCCFLFEFSFHKIDSLFFLNLISSVQSKFCSSSEKEKTKRNCNKANQQQCHQQNPDCFLCFNIIIDNFSFLVFKTSSFEIFNSKIASKRKISFECCCFFCFFVNTLCFSITCGDP